MAATEKVFLLVLNELIITRPVGGPKPFTPNDHGDKQHADHKRYHCHDDAGVHQTNIDHGGDRKWDADANDVSPEGDDHKALTSQLKRNSLVGRYDVTR
jgi:hypothetical protein